jgi:tetratricopeptide (TPR) repeat protein
MKHTSILFFICMLSLLNSCQKIKNEPDSNISNTDNFEKYIPDSGLLPWEKYIPDADILTKDFRNNFISKTISKERETRYSSSQNLFNNAMRQYQENDINSALEYIESAIKTSPESIYYYHYGVFLMNIGDFENAEKAFNVAIYFTYLKKNIYQEEYSLYTFDNNGFPREIYFAYYNLACIYSINMDLNKSLEYLFFSIERGYPYIDYLVSDDDLSNLLKSDNNMETLIKNKYQDGFKNILTGKIFEQDLAFDDVGYYFVDDKNVKKHFSANSNIRNHILHGTYEIKNYNVYIHFNRETGQKGVIGTEFGEASSNAIPYAKYEDYSSDIDENELLSIINIVSGEEWKEVNRYYDFYIQ